MAPRHHAEHASPPRVTSAALLHRCAPVRVRSAVQSNRRATHRRGQPPRHLDRVRPIGYDTKRRSRPATSLVSANCSPINGSSSFKRAPAACTPDRRWIAGRHRRRSARGQTRGRGGAASCSSTPKKRRPSCTNSDFRARRGFASVSTTKARPPSSAEREPHDRDPGGWPRYAGRRAHRRHHAKGDVAARRPPFIDHKLAEAQRSARIIRLLLLAHGADQIVSHVGDGGRWDSPRCDARRDRQLGTGGSLRQAARCSLRKLWVTYGDTLLDADLGRQKTTRARSTAAR